MVRFTFFGLDFHFYRHFILFTRSADAFCFFLPIISLTVLLVHCSAFTPMLSFGIAYLHICVFEFPFVWVCLFRILFLPLSCGFYVHVVFAASPWRARGTWGTAKFVFESRRPSEPLYNVISFIRLYGQESQQPGELWYVFWVWPGEQAAWRAVKCFFLVWPGKPAAWRAVKCF